MTTNSTSSPVRRALISVSDKTGIIEFSQKLHAADIEILSTGGTAKALADAGIPVTEVSDYTGFPEMMDGRLKTLHPKIHGGLLGRRGTDDEAMAEHNIQPIDLVVVNLYPFAETIAKPGCDLATAIENIDIGGPTMLRAAAKNHVSVAVVVNADDYDRVLADMDANNGAISDALRFELAMKTFEHTASYDGAIANYLGSIEEDGSKSKFPHTMNLHYVHAQSMRYGENPHQDAAFYIDTKSSEASVATSTQLQGKELSYNNMSDTDAALECVKEFGNTDPTCVIVKHANPCGVAIGNSLMDAYDRAYHTDPTSAFGGIIAFNGELDVTTAQAIIDRQFVEVIIAPSISADAAKVLEAKPNVRVLSCGAWDVNRPATLEFKRVTGGLLIQDRDLGHVTEADIKVVTERQPSADELRDLLFTWKVCKYVKSNAIIYGRDNCTVGVGAGQMSRVYSARIAIQKAVDENIEVAGSVMASDAFFPFRDGIDSAAEAGIKAVIQPGGSMRDNEVIDAANEHGIAMVFTGMRHFRH